MVELWKGVLMVVKILNNYMFLRNETALNTKYYNLCDIYDYCGLFIKIKILIKCIILLIDNEGRPTNTLSLNSHSNKH